MSSDDSPGDPSINPYAPTAGTGVVDAFLNPAALKRPASRFKRFIAFWIDALILTAITFPINVLSGFSDRAMRGEVSLLEQFLMSLVGMLVFLVLFGYLLVTRGQTVGKLVIGVRIVSATTGELLPFSKVYVYRYLWSLPLLVVVTIIPGTLDDLLISAIYLIDAVMIFGPERRCLHDYIAGSAVVEVVR